MKFYLSVWSFLLCVLGINSSVFAQLNITLADHTVRLGSKEESVFTYNLEEGQQLLLNVDVENQKEIQEISRVYAGII